MTDYNIHKPVLMSEVAEALALKPGGRYVDGTVGMGGHAAATLKASAPTGWLFGSDRDALAIETAGRRLAEFAGRFELRRMTFDELSGWIEPASCDGCLFDLGVSSPQLDTAERGFSFQQDAALDMRMDQRQPMTARDLVNDSDPAELARIFWELGGEKKSRLFARTIERERVAQPIETTSQLAGLIEKVAPRRGRKAHPATKAFMALRLAVNDEMGCLRRGLPVGLNLLKPGGRLVVITFHSLEDRIVKNFGREGAAEYTVPGDVDVPELRQPRQPDLRLVSRKAIKPTEAELTENPRARSAQLRVMERI